MTVTYSGFFWGALTTKASFLLKCAGKSFRGQLRQYRAYWQTPCHRMLPMVSITSLTDLGAVIINKWSLGQSVLGTLDAPLLSKYLPGPLSQGYPWGNRTVWNTDPTDFPNTGMDKILAWWLSWCVWSGVTRYYKWELSVGTVAPDGVPMNNTLLINGGYPGPVIEANWGDWIEVELTNNLCCEGTSLHW